jgi:Cu(I)/Ag(I) efflux system periplasmic protein CusF
MRHSLHPWTAAAIVAVATVAAAGTALAQAPTVGGEVVKIDEKAGRITLKHGEIKHLDMPAMTMSWRVRSPALLEGLKNGDRVRFVAEKVDGQFTVTQILKAPG